MQPSSVQAVRARARKLYDSSTAEERSVLDLLLAAADEAEAGGDAAGADGADVEGFAIRQHNVGFSVMKSLESQDKLGNFEIQDLMSAFNQAQALSSNVQNTYTNTQNSVIGNI